MNEHHRSIHDRNGGSKIHSRTNNNIRSGSRLDNSSEGGVLKLNR